MKNFKYVSGLEGKLIWSVYQQDRSEKENFLDYQRVRTELRQRGIRAIPVLGMYQGKTECSFIVNAVHIVAILKLAESCKQESILRIKFDNVAELIYLEGSPKEQIGSCWRVSKEIAETFVCWTYHEESGAAWVCG